MTCDDFRALFLDHLYGVLDDDETAALEAHLAACDPCCTELAAAEARSELLADAAALEMPDLDLSRPIADDVEPAPVLRRPWWSPRPWMGIAAAVLLGIAGTGLGYRSHQRSRAVAHHPILTLTAPDLTSPDEDAEVRFTLTDADGAPLVAPLQTRVLNGLGETVLETTVTPDASGVATLAVPANLKKSGEHLSVFARSQVPGADNVSLLQPLRVTGKLLARVAPDKPLYRPGDPVRVRLVTLDRLHLVPSGDTRLHVKLEDPKGDVLAESDVQSIDGVAAWTGRLGSEAVGGRYTLRATHADGLFPEVTQTFQVRPYRTPRIAFVSDLDRDAYAPGASGRVDVAVTRVEGGVPQDAEVRTIFRVDGEQVAVEELDLPASGILSLPFTVPADVATGRAEVVVSVRDAGGIETHVVPVQVTTGRLAVELYPEGGDLVDGLPTRVYFRVTDPAGRPADLQAEIVDDQGAVAATAAVLRNGLGAFHFTPRSGRTYTLRSVTPKDVRLDGAFPAVQERGVALLATQPQYAAGAPIDVTLTSSTTGTHVIDLACRGIAIGRTEVDLVAGQPTDVALTPDEDVAGAIRVTVTGPAGVPRAERLVARAASRSLQLDLAPEYTEYAPGERVTVRVTSKDEQGRPSRAVLGVTVRDRAVERLADDRDTASFAQHFLIGQSVDVLENAAYYEEGPEAARMTDLLLGVQGWRRFAWQDTAALAKTERSGISGPVLAARIEPVVPAAKQVVNDATADDARRSVRRAVRRTDERLGQASAVTAFGGLFLLALFLAVTGIAKGRKVRGSIGVGILGLYVAVFVILPQTMGNRFADMAPSAVMEMAAGDATTSDAGAEESEEVLGWGDPDSDLAPLAGGTGGGWQFGGAGGGGVARDERVPISVDDALFGTAGRVVESDSDDGVDAFFGDDVNLDPTGEYFGDEEFGPGLTAGSGGGSGGSYRYRNRYPQVARHYAHQHRPGPDGARADFTDVLYWNPLLVTDAAGQASFSFETSDVVTTFVVAADAHDSRGALTSHAATLTNRLPFYLDPKLPAELSAGDRLELPVSVANGTRGALSVDVEMRVDGDLAQLDGGRTRGLDVEADRRGRALFPITIGQGRGDVALAIGGRAGTGLRDRWSGTARVVPRGYPMEISTGDRLDGTGRLDLLLPDDFRGEDLDADLRFFPSVLSTLIEGLDGLLREPTGCFEQTSSSNHPNVLVLQYLEENQIADPAAARRARAFVAKGYERLTGFECPEGGFDLYGQGPADPALTAYGLLQFHDIAKVHDVDPALIARTRDWLLARRDGKGGFTMPQNGWRPGGAVYDAFTTWALTEADIEATEKVNLDAELDLLAKRARDDQDPYVIALAANALANRERDGWKSLLRLLADAQKDDGSITGTTSSVMGSGGSNLAVETTALSVLAFLRTEDHTVNVDKAMRYLASARDGSGRFGATQATSLALRAVVAYGKTADTRSQVQNVTVKLNGRPVGTVEVPVRSLRVPSLGNDFAAALVPGVNRMELTSDGEGAIPWSAHVRYRTKRPPSSPDCAVTLTTSLGAERVREGDPVTLTATLVNVTSAAVPTPLARIGLPAGLEAQTKDLDRLVDEQVISTYELRGREVVLYFRHLDAGERRTIPLTLVAAVPGTFEGPASQAYLYYTDDVRTWQAPLRAVIEAR